MELQERVVITNVPTTYVNRLKIRARVEGFDSLSEFMREKIKGFATEDVEMDSLRGYRELTKELNAVVNAIGEALRDSVEVTEENNRINQRIEQNLLEMEERYGI